MMLLVTPTHFLFFNTLSVIVNANFTFVHAISIIYSYLGLINSTFVKVVAVGSTTNPHKNDAS